MDRGKDSQRQTPACQAIVYHSIVMMQHLNVTFLMLFFYAIFLRRHQNSYIIDYISGEKSFYLFILSSNIKLLGFIY